MTAPTPSRFAKLVNDRMIPLREAYDKMCADLVAFKAHLLAMDTASRVQILRDALDHSKGDTEEAAALLGLTYHALWKHLRKHGLLTYASTLRGHRPRKGWRATETVHPAPDAPERPSSDT